MAEEAQRIVTTIKQMEASLNDDDSRHRDETDDEELQITYPLTECLQGLKEKQLSVSKRHKERFEQVKSKRTSDILPQRLSMLTGFQNWHKP